jgi:environmental stress-induced protein Ves
MPWKNGGGSTTELLVEPPSGSLASGFHWRVSMAPLESSGPFSSFPGLDRTLLLLEGGGLRVDHGPRGSATLARPLEACTFPGEWATTGQLLAGPCRDFNVMSDRTKVRHEVYVLRPGPVLTPLPAGPVVLVFCASGQASIPILGETLEPVELLCAEGLPALGVQAQAPDTALIAVVFHPLEAFKA